MVGGAVTPARRRVLGKALAFGQVFRRGGFGAAAAGRVSGPVLVEASPDAARFDRGHVIDACVRKGWLCYGAGANAYAITPAGRLAIEPRRVG